MKTVKIIAALLLFTSFTNARTINYQTEMGRYINSLDTIKTSNGYLNLAKNFKKIAVSNEKEWLPNYYTAYCNLVSAIRGAQNEEEKDEIYDKATKYIERANILDPNNSEIYTLKGYITFMQMAVYPQQRAMKMIPEANALIAKAIQLNPENPRAYLLKGQNTFYTPEMFGGGKADAKQILLTAKDKFEKFKPENLAPHWGKERCNELLNEYQQ